MDKKPLIRSFGRRKVKPLSALKQAKLQNAMEQLCLPEKPLQSLQNLFKPTTHEVHLDIGFGGGENLAEKVIANPNIGYIGSEVFFNGIAAFLNHLPDPWPGNIRLFTEDIRLLLPYFPAESLDKVYLLYPDPWHKARHHKRRMIAMGNLDLIARTMKKGSILELASDIENYIEMAEENFEKHPAFKIISLTKKPWDHWTTTRYEQKAFREGRTPQYMTVEKI